jgi:hypothetical protein
MEPPTAATLTPKAYRNGGGGGLPSERQKGDLQNGGPVFRQASENQFDGV